MASECQSHDNSAKLSGWRHKAAFGGFLAVSLFYLVMEHMLHLFGFLSYFLVVICPLMHLMLHGHQGVRPEHKEHSP